ncbi:MAG: hypothetical protein ACYC9L_05440 [Sulfuricaulis sp.]
MLSSALGKMWGNQSERAHMDFTTNKALISAGVAITASIIGLLVAFGVTVTSNQRDAIITFITVTLPAVLGLIGWLHHGHVTIKAAAAATAPAVPSPTK